KRSNRRPKLLRRKPKPDRSSSPFVLSKPSRSFGAVFLFYPALHGLWFEGRIIDMKRFLILSLVLLPLAGCNGSGAVNPLTPSNASKAEITAAADSEVIYWTTFPTTFTFTEPLNAICLVNKKLGWACGNNGLILQYDGQTWNRVQPALATNENFMGIAFLDENE